MRPNVCGLLVSRTDPAHQGEENARKIERTKDNFVVLGQPYGKVDIEVRPPIARVPGSDRGEWATPPIENEHGDFAGDYGGEPPGSAVLAEP